VLFEKLRTGGDTSEPVTLGLALAQFTRFSGWGVSGSPGSTTADLQQAADLLKPLTQSTATSRQSRITYADVLNYMSHRRADKEQAVADCEEGRKVLVELGALDLTDLYAASVYADTSDSQARHELDLGRVEEAARLEQEVYDIAEKVLAQRPADLRSMANRALAAGFLGALAARRHDYSTAAEFAAKAEQAGEDYVRFNPADLGSWVYWVRGRDAVAEAQFEQGRVRESIATQRSVAALENDSRAPSNLEQLLNFSWFDLAMSEARANQSGAAEESLREAIRANDAVVAQEGKNSPRGLLLRVIPDGVRARLQLYAGEDLRAFESAGDVITSVGQVAIPEDNAGNVMFRQNLRRFSLTTQAVAAIRMRRYAEAEALSRARLDLPDDSFSEADPQDETSRAKVVLAHAIAEQGRGAEALGLVEPVLVRYRDERTRGADGVSLRRDVAHALFVSAISQPADAAGRAKKFAALAEASALIGGLSAEAQRLADLRIVAEMIAAERSGS
jgi:hypothetical protein